MQPVNKFAITPKSSPPWRVKAPALVPYWGFPVVPFTVTLTGNNTLVPVTLTSSNTIVRVMTDRPLQIEQPILVHNDRPLIVETGSRPLVVQSMPATSSARPGPGE